MNAMDPLQDLCLTCLSKPVARSYDLSDVILDKLKVMEILKILIPNLMENPEIPLPNCICQVCVDKLINAHTYQKQCRESLEKLYNSWKNDFKEDIIKLEIEGLYEDDVDEVNFKIEESFKENNFAIDEEQNFRCKFCVESFQGINELNRHIKCKHKEDKQENNEVYREASEHSFEEIYTKEYEDFDLDTSQDNEIAASINDNKEELKSMINSTENKEKNINNKDRKLVNDEIPTSIRDVYKCNICGKTFKQSQGLNLHKARIHSRKHPFKCETCPKGFMVEEHYVKHRNRHLGIKTFKCKECGKAFDSNSTLNQHMISHSKETPHLCTICGKSFNRSGTLRQHILRHGDATPYKCTQCSKQFKCHSDLLSHIAKHNADKYYECEICGKRLATSTSMLHHKLVHSGEKPFKCDFCDRSFNSSSNLKCHIRIHTGEKPYNCPFCDKTFRQSNDCRKHAKRMHPKEWSATNKELGSENNN